MEYRTGQEMERVAEVFPDLPSTDRLSRSEKLTRWAAVLRSDPSRRLNTLLGTEFQSLDDRARMRSDDSPLTVAFADGVLRRNGLRDDSYGEAKRFFELSDGQLHRILCHCHSGPTVTAERVASRISAIARRRGLSFGVFLTRTLARLGARARPTE